jgi:putative acetyltransferase
MIAQSAPLSTPVALAEEDPNSPDAIALFDEMSAFVLRTYPEDEENGIVPTTTEELAQHGVLVIARVDGEAAGSGALMSHTPVDGAVTMEVKRMLVRPAFRGMGISKRVLAQLEQTARERRVERLVLMCGPRQPEALRLYERSGYARRSAYGNHVDHPLSIFFEKNI